MGSRLAEALSAMSDIRDGTSTVAAAPSAITAVTSATVAAIESLATTTTATVASATTAAASATSACAPQDTEPSHNTPPGLDLTLRELFLDVGAVAALVTLINCTITFVSHFIWRSNYREQKHLARIAFLPACFAIFYWCGILRYGAGVYLTPMVGIYEVYTISCFFEYMIEIVIPDGQTREDYFISTTRMSRFRRRQRHNSGTYRWYKVARMFIYFGLFFVFVTQVLELILAAKVCHTSETYESVHTLLEILSIFFISWALIALLMTYSQFQPVYSELHLLRTFWVYKGIVLLYMIETFAITIIEAAGAAPPTRYMSEADFVWGVHAFMVACQSCIFSFGYVAMLSGLRYRQRRGYVQVSTSNKGPNFSVGRLLWAVAFPTEAFAGFWEALGTFFGLFRGRKGYDYTAGTGVGHEERVAKTDESDQGLNLGEGSTRYSNSPDQSGGA